GTQPEREVQCRIASAPTLETSPGVQPAPTASGQPNPTPTQPGVCARELHTQGSVSGFGSGAGRRTTLGRRSESLRIAAHRAEASAVKIHPGQGRTRPRVQSKFTQVRSDCTLGRVRHAR